jgi:predicted phosphate transport protein (TIGR00153 family)
MLPKEGRFFELFDRQMELIVAATGELKQLLAGGEEIEEHCRSIVQLEHEADDVTRQVLLALRKTFVTPFDRGDITDLATSMDDAMDAMHEAAKAIMRFELRSFEAPMQDVADRIVAAAALLAEAIPLLARIGPNVERLASLTEQVVRLEGEADDIHDEALKTLYRRHGADDPMGYLVGSEIYEHLERVVDRLEDVANQINAIVLESV